MTPDFEFYATPDAFTRYLFQSVNIGGTLFEPCVGDGAIVRASTVGHGSPHNWLTNDLDSRWPADANLDATTLPAWFLGGNDYDWTVSNPPFTPAIEILDRAIAFSNIGVAMHLRASIHEVLKTGVRRTWMAQHPPTGILWLPRFAYQRSRTTGKWTTDSVCACWAIWLKDPAAPQFIRYAPEWVIDALDQETPDYRARMDRLSGFSGIESLRQRQCVARWKDAA